LKFKRYTDANTNYLLFQTDDIIERKNKLLSDTRNFCNVSLFLDQFTITNNIFTVPSKEVPYTYKWKTWLQLYIHHYL